MADNQNKKQDIMKTFSIIYVIIAILFAIVLWNVIKLSTFGGAGYRSLSQKSGNDSLVVNANRGNIYDCNGKLLASTIPSFRLHMDMRDPGLVPDTLNKYIDSLCINLSRLYGTATPSEFKQRLRGAYNTGSRYFLVDKKRLSYTQYKQVLGFPLFRNKSLNCIVWEEQIKREHPFGKLAARTIGNNYAAGKGYTGLEMAFDKELSGKPGIAFKQKKGGQKIFVNVVDPEDGLDIVSTLDINMQDITEEALEKRLVESDAEWGCAILMEVSTGEVKAMANLTRGKDSTYAEEQNNAISSMTEPGSTFKIASVMAALDDGLADTSEIFDTGFGYWKKDDWTMTDHNVKSRGGQYLDEGGYHKISLAQSIWYSSNIGIAKMVDKYYHNKPRKFVDRLYEMRLKEPLDIVLPGAATPKFKDPSDPDWNNASLLWMSFGYNVQIPPIYMLTFYNAIANNGKMVSPIFVKSINENGTPLKNFGTKVVNPSLCSSKTLKQVQKMLEGVITEGTGKNFKSETVTFAGKTGTTQTNYWQGQRNQHQMSFCGYFPAEQPKYSCIVVVYHPNHAAGNPAGLTFREIAEKISARNFTKDLNGGLRQKAPNSLRGDRKSLETIYEQMKVPYVRECSSSNDWVVVNNNNEARADISALHQPRNGVPNVMGMGAKDAIFLMEKNGLKPSIQGFGFVTHQSIEPGAAVKKGTPIELILNHR